MVKRKNELFLMAVIVFGGVRGGSGMGETGVGSSFSSMRGAGEVNSRLV